MSGLFENLIVASERGRLEYDMRIHLVDLRTKSEYSEKIAESVINMLLQLCQDLGIEQEGKLELGDKSFYFSRREGGLALAYFYSKSVDSSEVTSLLKEVLSLRREVYINGGSIEDLRKEINKFLIYYMGVHNFSLLFFKNSLMTQRGVKSIIIYYKNKVSIDGIKLNEVVKRSILRLIRKIQNFWDLSIDFVKARINNSHAIIVYVSKDFYISFLYDKESFDLNTISAMIMDFKKRLSHMRSEPLRIPSDLLPLYEKLLENYKLVDSRKASTLLDEDLKKLVFEECLTLKEALLLIDRKGGFPVVEKPSTPSRGQLTFQPGS
ncbi:MAG: hypothetical protein DRJ52_03050 [Thermoprotei archaeon]|nr:MAG: hypothetical protein DRJ52_03050 [Thermoprotei archaeon]RLF00023.1 MAG: hypothetical protein DRJ63_03630 [Thermoprotei archaeon]HDI75227.1 hypothetical protein [Thermoprotei archaeon]